MKISVRYYPHPVLSDFSDDILDSRFKTNIDIEYKDISYIFNIECELSNADLWRYIECGKACYAIHVECPNTRMREVFTSRIDKSSFEILADKLHGKVEVNIFIVACERINNYNNSRFHEDYKGINFTIMKGDVLAISEGIKFDADKEKDDLKHIPSIFTIGKNNDTNAPPLDVDFGQTNKIVIKLSNDIFEYYVKMSRSSEMSKILASMILIPTLVSLLEQIKISNLNYDHYEECRWFGAIETRLKILGYDLENELIDSSIVIAHKIIGDPLSSSLKELFDNGA